MKILEPGDLIELNDRIFKVGQLFFLTDGSLGSITARCLTPKDEDGGKVWWSLQLDEDSDEPEPVTVH